MEKVKILWSGITGRTGSLALKYSKSNEHAEIVAGVCRHDPNYYNYDNLDTITEDFDVIVDFSHKDSFDKILDFALKVNKPLIIGTVLSTEQEKEIRLASHIIPIFKGGNFQFKVKEFINDVLEYAKNFNKEFVLLETHYKNKKLPSETAKFIAKKVLAETGIHMEIKSFTEYDEIINDYKVANLHCRVVGFDQLAKDVLKVAYLMKDKKPLKLYDLSNIE